MKKIFLAKFTGTKVSEDFFEKILNVVEKKEKIKRGFSLEIVLLGEKKMRGINKRYAGKNKITSVLSFPLSEIKKSSKKELRFTPLNKNNLKGFIEPQKENNLLGEILLCPSRIKKISIRKKEDFKKELAFNFVHGFLHLLGYNHKNTEDTRKMRRRERKILSKIKI